MTPRAFAIGGVIAVLGAGLTLSAQSQNAGKLGKLWQRNAGVHAHKQRWTPHSVPVQKNPNATAQASGINRTTATTTPGNAAARAAASTVTTVPGTETTVERTGKGAG